MIKRIFATLTLILSTFCSTGVLQTAFAQDKSTFTVAQNTGNDLAAIQKTIDEATAKGGIAHIPAGEYSLDGDLWLASNSILRGVGDATVLRFSKGKIRSLKNGSKNFYYINNYNNEIVPNDVKTPLNAPAASGATVFQVANASIFRAGDWIYSSNDIKDSWTILEDLKRPHLWNNPKTAFARQETFQITSIDGNTLQLDRPLRFALDKGATIHKHAGAHDFEVSSLKIINPEELQPLLFEQPMDARFSHLTVQAKGGITITHNAYNNVIENCHFITNGFRGITVEYFSAKNRAVNNKIDYAFGGDCALIVMMSCHDNVVAYNQIVRTGGSRQQRDEAGIYIHATSYNNVVHHNVIDGTWEAIGSFYSASDNIFFENQGTNVRVGIQSYYARNNTYVNNRFAITAKGKYDAVGASFYASYGNLLLRNNIAGNFADGVRIQGSHNNDFLNNAITGPGGAAITRGFRYISKDTNTGDTFNGVDPKSGLRRGNVISGVAQEEKTE